MTLEVNKIHCTDCTAGMKLMADKSVDCIVTSPPYFGLRNYGHDDQIGLEDTPEQFVARLMEVFAEGHRVLKDTGTLWLNLGDTYAATGKNRTMEQATHNSGLGGGKLTQGQSLVQKSKIVDGLKQKDLIGIPWMVAFALRSAGWYLRQDIIWSKPNPMPESVTDRCTKSHEYIFLLSKAPKYYFDADAIKTPVKPESIQRGERGVNGTHKHVNGAPGQPPHSLAQPRKSGNKERKEAAARGVPAGTGKNQAASVPWEGILANKRSVWTVTTKPFSEAHFATFPQELIVDMIKAGCPEGGTVLDPFGGAGTTAVVARKLNRNFILFELNPEYVAIAETRLKNEIGMFL